MYKNFKKWLAQKITLHEFKNRAHFHEQEIWFVSIGVNIGDEQDGSGVDYLRPALVLKKFNANILWCLPITKQFKAGSYYYHIMLREKKQSIILSQLRIIDAKRLGYYIGRVSRDDFSEIKRRLRQLLA